MESPPDPGDPTPHHIEALVDYYVKCTASSREEALFFLKSYDFDLGNAVVNYFFDLSAFPEPIISPSTSQDQESQADPSSPLRSPWHSPSPASPAAHAPHQLGLPQDSENKVENEDSGSGSGGIRTVTDLNKNVSEDRSARDESDQGQDYYTGGEQRCARQAGAVEKQNGLTVDDGPSRRMDDPANGPFLESHKKSELPEELDPAVNLKFERRNQNEDYPEPERHPPAFPGTRKTLGSNDAGSPAAASEPAAISTSPGCGNPTTPYMGLVMDDSLPTTSIQIRLQDGTRIRSRFNYSHTIRDIRAFIDASRSGGARDYRLQAMGFPPKQLTDVDQTIEQAGIANSYVIEKP